MSLSPTHIGFALNDNGSDEPRFVVTLPPGRHFNVPESIFRRLERFADDPTDLQASEDARNILGHMQGLPVRPLLKKGYWFRVALVSPRIAKAISQHLTWPFANNIWQPACLILAAVVGYMLMFGQTLATRSLGGTADVLISIGLALSAYALHEFGHASALKRFGQSPGAIGFAVYLVWPAFYSDVSSAWRLPSRQRALVDVAGVYFEMFTAPLYLAALLLTHERIWLLAFYMTVASAITNANPVFRFDGYWLVRDLFDVTNVWQMPGRMAARYGSDLKRLIAAQALSGVLCLIWIFYAVLVIRRLVWLVAAVWHGMASL
jgi:putative peptide zinc metalloprotease protein